MLLMLGFVLLNLVGETRKELIDNLYEEIFVIGMLMDFFYRRFDDFGLKLLESIVIRRRSTNPLAEFFQGDFVYTLTVQVLEVDIDADSRYRIKSYYVL